MERTTTTTSRTKVKKITGTQKESIMQGGYNGKYDEERKDGISTRKKEREVARGNVKPSEIFYNSPQYDFESGFSRNKK